jgi:hypothetical protein
MRVAIVSVGSGVQSSIRPDRVETSGRLLPEKVKELLGQVGIFLIASSGVHWQIFKRTSAGGITGPLGIKGSHCSHKGR